MENASKALIIAGAILLAIAIIGIGMYVYNMASSTIQGANMTQNEITAYNSEFVKYEGKQSGTTVKALCDAVRAHNIATDATEKAKKIIIKVVTTDLTGTTVSNDDLETGTTPAEISTVKNGISSGTKYNVTFNYTSTGLIKEIGLKK